MVRPRSGSVERSKPPRVGGVVGGGGGGGGSHHRTVVKEQFRLPRDLVEKMPSASNSPVPSRKAECTGRQQLSVASMVRRFETREDKTRAGMDFTKESNSQIDSTTGLVAKAKSALKTASSPSATIEVSPLTETTTGTSQPTTETPELLKTIPHLLLNNTNVKINKRSESDGIVLTDKPKPVERSVRRAESVLTSKEEEHPAQPFTTSVTTQTSATIVKGPEDAVRVTGQSLKLIAHYFGCPEPKVTWLRNGKKLSENPPRICIEIPSSGGESTLTVLDLTNDDGGKYEFLIENRIGSDSASSSVSVLSKPEPPAGRPFISDIDYDTRSITLAWYGSTFDGGSIVTGYCVEMTNGGVDSDDTDWVVLRSGMNSTSYIHKGLDPGQEYRFRVRSENAHGMSEPSLPSEPVTFDCNEQNDGNGDFNGDNNNLENENENDGEGGGGGEDDVDDGNTDQDELSDFESFEAPFKHRIVQVESGDIFKRKYEIYEELGRGRFGVVFKVRDRDTGKTSAAKFVRCRKSEDRQKVHDEIGIMNSLDYAKLLQLSAAYENPREIIMVMEYIGGGELFEKVVADDFTLTERDCVLFMRQICAAIGYMHAKDIVHLDLKPENILCRSKRSHQIKIIDFGLARKLNPTEEVRILFGTPEFVSPEVISYEPVSTTSDMWSVGVVCYVLLSGLSPFMGDSDVDTFANISGIAYDFDDEAFDPISDEAKDFIRKLLVKNKRHRMSAYECLQHPWLAQGQDQRKSWKEINTDKLKSFLMRRRWQKAAHAIRALGRFTSLGFRQDSKDSSGLSTHSADF